MRIQLMILACGLALAACGESTPEAESNVTTEVKIDSHSDRKGEMELKLPGGFEAKIPLPKGAGDKSDFDIDGVGLYPGARVSTVNVRAGEGPAVVTISFAAPGSAPEVAQWYERELLANDVVVKRTGEMLVGRTEDGDDFTLEITQALAGSTGLLTITDAAKG